KGRCHSFLHVGKLFPLHIDGYISDNIVLSHVNNGEREALLVPRNIRPNPRDTENKSLLTRLFPHKYLVSRCIVEDRKRLYVLFKNRGYGIMHSHTLQIDTRQQDRTRVNVARMHQGRYVAGDALKSLAKLDFEIMGLH